MIKAACKDLWVYRDQGLDSDQLHVERKPMTILMFPVGMRQLVLSLRARSWQLLNLHPRESPPNGCSERAVQANETYCSLVLASLQARLKIPVPCDQPLV